MPERSSRYRLTPLAESDLEEIWLLYTANMVPRASRQLFPYTLGNLRRARGRDKTGRPVEIREGYLKYNVGSHIVFYRRAGQTTDIIRILHQRMDIGRHL
ncbi:type II toxin-antitoxin system RelE/ParE family toxin [Labrys sp. (in: a-proteobacteria)]|uniref:type II toxin-antitoxin system RelE/ParE family toxin n=1 Tax=Labrys sp. (in: a-proteobacteria) TaxID=1917972 RepID=UPI0039E67A48